MSSVKSKRKKTPSLQPSNSKLQNDSDSGRIERGMCSFCHERLTAIQPGGIDPRHMDGTPYRMCQQAMRPYMDFRPTAQGEPLVPDSVFLEAQAFNERHRAILEDPANDPTNRGNWDYKPGADGNKKIMTYKPFKGLK